MVGAIWIKPEWIKSCTTEDETGVEKCETMVPPLGAGDHFDLIALMLAGLVGGCLFQFFLNLFYAPLFFFLVAKNNKASSKACCCCPRLLGAVGLLHHVMQDLAKSDATGHPAVSSDAQDWYCTVWVWSKKGASRNHFDTLRRLTST